MDFSQDMPMAGLHLSDFTKMEEVFKYVILARFMGGEGKNYLHCMGKAVYSSGWI